MSVLSDRSITALMASLSDSRLRVEPLGENAVQPASVDVRLGNVMLQRERGTIVDPMLGHGPRWQPATGDDDGTWLLWPGMLYLGATLEWLQIPNDVLCHLHGRSSLGREGVVIHQTAGLLDPGYRGNPTLEITVTHSTRLRAGMPIGQLTFQRLTTPAQRPYGSDGLGSRYQDDTTPQPSRVRAATP